MPARDYRPVPATLGGDTPNPGALEMSLASVLLPGLAAFSLARGIGGVLRPNREHVASTGLARLIGLGQLAVAFGLLSGGSGRNCLMARAALDTVDAANRIGGGAGAASTARRALSALLDVYAATKVAPAGDARAARLQKPEDVSRAITIGRPAAELYRLARALPALQQGSRGEPNIEVLDEKRSRLAMLGRQFDIAITDETENERIAFVVDGMGARADGTLTFRPAPKDRGTEATLRLRLPPAWRGPAIPALSTALSRFKALAETGTIPKLHPLPSARH